MRTFRTSLLEKLKPYLSGRLTKSLYLTAISSVGVTLVVVNFTQTLELTWQGVVMLIAASALTGYSFEAQDEPENTRMVAKLSNDVSKLRDDIGLMKLAGGVRDYDPDR